MDDEKIIMLGCLGWLFLFGLPSIAVITLIICEILANMIPPM